MNDVLKSLKEKLSPRLVTEHPMLVTVETSTPLKSSSSTEVSKFSLPSQFIVEILIIKDQFKNLLHSTASNSRSLTLLCLRSLLE